MLAPVAQMARILLVIQKSTVYQTIGDGGLADPSRRVLLRSKVGVTAHNRLRWGSSPLGATYFPRARPLIHLLSNS